MKIENQIVELSFDEVETVNGAIGPALAAAYVGLWLAGATLGWIVAGDIVEP